MATAPVVPGVFPEFQEVEQVVMPSLQIGAARTLSLSTLIHCHEQIVVEFQERNHALAFAVGAPDVASGSTHARPRSA